MITSRGHGRGLVSTVLPAAVISLAPAAVVGAGAMQRHAVPHACPKQRSATLHGCHMLGSHPDPTNPWLPWNNPNNHLNHHSHYARRPIRHQAAERSWPAPVTAPATGCCSPAPAVTAPATAGRSRQRGVHVARCCPDTPPTTAQQPPELDLHPQHQGLGPGPGSGDQGSQGSNGSWSGTDDRQGMERGLSGNGQQHLQAQAQAQGVAGGQQADDDTTLNARKDSAKAQQRQARRDAAAADPLVAECGGSVGEARRELTRRVRRVRNVRQLQALAQRHRPLLNRVHVCAVLTRLKQLAGKRGWMAAEAGEEAGTGGAADRLARTQATREALAWLPSFLPATAHLVPHFTMVEVAGCLHALARLSARPPINWMDQLLETALPLLRSASTPTQLGITLWSLGKLGCDPGEAWLDGACAASIHVLRWRPQRRGRAGRGTAERGDSGRSGNGQWAGGRGRFSTTVGTPGTAADQAIAGLSAAAARAGEGAGAPGRPAELEWAVDVEAQGSVVGSGGAREDMRLMARPVWRHGGGPADEGEEEGDEEQDPRVCSDATLVAFTWGLAKLQHNVPPVWSEVICAEVAARWQGMNAFCLSNLSWSLATLGVDPGKEWLKEFSEVSWRVLPSANSYDLSVLLWAHVIWGHRPHEEWLSSFFSSSSRTLPSAEPEHIARYLWCCAALRWRPPGPWLRRVLQQTQVQAFEFDGQAVGNSLWALAKLGIKPPSEWLETLLVATYEQGLEGWGPQELSNTMWALGTWRHAPEPAWADLFWSEALSLMNQFSPQQQVNMLWGAVRTGQAPPKQCLAQLLKVSSRSLTQFSLEGAATLLTCLGQLEHAPSQAWIKGFFRDTLPLVQARAAAIHRTSSRGEDGGVVRAEAIHVSSSRGEDDGVARAAAVHISSSLGEGGVSRAAGIGTSRSREDEALPTPNPGQVPIGEQEPSGTQASDVSQDRGGTQAIDARMQDSGGTQARSCVTRRRGGGVRPSGVTDGLVCEKLISPLAVLRITPPEEWSEAFLGMSYAAMPTMRQGNLASVAYGVVVLGLHPSPAWVDALVQAGDRHLGPGGAKQVNRISLGKLLYAARLLPGAEEAYQRWRMADWIADAMEMYGLTNNNQAD